MIRPVTTWSCHTRCLCLPEEVPLKMAYREQVERLYQGGSNMIGKQHQALYPFIRSCTTKAFTARNVLSGWSKSVLRPLNPDKVLKDIPKPDQPVVPMTLDVAMEPNNIRRSSLETPTTEGRLACLTSDLLRDSRTGW